MPDERKTAAEVVKILLRLKNEIISYCQKNSVNLVVNGTDVY